MLRNKIVRFKKIYKSYFDHFFDRNNSFSYKHHFFKSRSSDIVLLKLENLHQNPKCYEARNTERDTYIEAWSATITRSRALDALIIASEARDENVRAKRADFLLDILCRASKGQSLTADATFVLNHDQRIYEGSKIPLALPSYERGLSRISKQPMSRESPKEIVGRTPESMYNNKNGRVKFSTLSEEK